MTDRDQHNERIKLWTSTLANGGLALMSAGLVYIFVESKPSLGDWPLVWVFVGAVGIMLAGVCTALMLPAES